MASKRLFVPQAEPLTPERVRRIMKKTGMTQEDLGGVLGYTGNTVGRWTRDNIQTGHVHRRQSRMVSLALAEIERQFEAFEEERRRDTPVRAATATDAQLQRVNLLLTDEEISAIAGELPGAAENTRRLVLHILDVLRAKQPPKPAAAAAGAA